MIKCIFPDVQWNCALHRVTFLVESLGFLFWWLLSTLLMWIYQCKHVISRTPGCWHTASLYGWYLRSFIKILLKVKAEMFRLQARFLRGTVGAVQHTVCWRTRSTLSCTYERYFQALEFSFPTKITFCISTPQSCVSFRNRSRRRNIEVPAKASLGLGNEYR